MKYTTAGNSVVKGAKQIAHCDSTDIAVEICDMLNAKQDRQTEKFRRMLNADLAKILVTNKYFVEMPVLEIGELLEKHGIDSTPLREACFSGNDGQENISFGDSVYLLFAWYKVPSGKWEITAYFN